MATRLTFAEGYDAELDELLDSVDLPALDDPSGLINRFFSKFQTERITDGDIWEVLDAAESGCLQSAEEVWRTIALMSR